MDRHAMAGHPRVGAEPREVQRLPQEQDVERLLSLRKQNPLLGCRVALSPAQRPQLLEAAEISNPGLLSSKNKSRQMERLSLLARRGGCARRKNVAKQLQRRRRGGGSNSGCKITRTGTTTPSAS